MILDAMDKLTFGTDSLLEQFFTGSRYFSPNQLCLKDGRKVEIRQISNCHEDGIFNLLKNLSETSKRTRFCTSMNNVGDQFYCNLAQATVKRCQENGFGLIVFDRKTQAPVAMSHYVENGVGLAEFCITIADRWQGVGLGKMMTTRVIKTAKANGVVSMEAVVANDNTAMKLILMRSGYSFSKAYYPNCMCYKLHLI